MSKCKECPFWKWVRKDTLYDTRGYHYCEKNELTTCMKRNMSSIDSLPEEEPSKELEEEIQNTIDKYPLNKEDMSEDDIATYHQGLIFGARHFAEWGRKQVLQEIYDGKIHPVDSITAAWL